MDSYSQSLLKDVELSVNETEPVPVTVFVVPESNTSQFSATRVHHQTIQYCRKDDGFQAEFLDGVVFSGLDKGNGTRRNLERAVGDRMVVLKGRSMFEVCERSGG